MSTSRHEAGLFLVRSRLRCVNVIVNMDDPLSPPSLLQGIKNHDKDVSVDERHRLLAIEILVCPQDRQPVLAAECGSCPKFVRRFGDVIYCRR